MAKAKENVIERNDKMTKRHCLLDVKRRENWLLFFVDIKRNMRQLN